MSQAFHDLGRAFEAISSCPHSNFGAKQLRTAKDVLMDWDMH